MDVEEDRTKKGAIVVGAESFLLSAPICVTEHIFSFCDYPSIQLLQKSCSILRSFLDKEKYKRAVYSIGIRRGRESLYLNICLGTEAPINRKSLFPRGPLINLEYAPHPEGCVIRMEKRKGAKKETIVPNADYVHLFWNDFRTLLSQSTTGLAMFKVDFDMLEAELPEPDYENLIDEFLDDFQSLVGALGEIETVAFWTRVRDDDQLFAILPGIDQDHLKKIMLWPMVKAVKSYDEEHIMMQCDLYKCQILLQWGNAEEVIIKGMDVMESTLSFSHFIKADVRIGEICVRNLRSLMRSFFDSGNIEKQFNIIFQHICSTVFRVMDVATGNKYYYRSDRTELILEFFLRYSSFKMRLLPPSELPKGHVIRDFDFDDDGEEEEEADEEEEDEEDDDEEEDEEDDDEEEEDQEEDEEEEEENDDEEEEDDEEEDEEEEDNEAY